jgi:hypothetical protein
MDVRGNDGSECIGQHVPSCGGAEDRKRDRNLCRWHLKKSLPGSGSIVYTLRPNLMVGRHGNGGTRYFNGTIYEVKIYNQSLSASQISTLPASSGPDGGTVFPSPLSILLRQVIKRLRSRITMCNFTGDITRPPAIANVTQNTPIGRRSTPITRGLCSRVALPRISRASIHDPDTRWIAIPGGDDWPGNRCHR